MEVQRHGTGCTISTVHAFKLLPLSDFGCTVMPMSVTCMCLFVLVGTAKRRCTVMIVAAGEESR